LDARSRITYVLRFFLLFFFFNDPTPTAISTLSLHDALPICAQRHLIAGLGADVEQPEHVGALRHLGGDLEDHPVEVELREDGRQDRKSTRLNSSHVSISYAVFCLKKKKKI